MSIKKSIFLGILGILVLLLFLWEMMGVIGLSLWIENFDSFFIAQIRGNISSHTGNTLAFLTHFGSAEFVGVASFVLMLIFFYKHRFALGIWFMGSIVVSGVLLKIAKELIKRDRPDSSYWLIQASGYSFPSGHSFSSSVFYLLVAFLLINVVKKPQARFFIGLVAILIVFFMMYARVYLGVHFPSDVLGGFLLGLSLTFFSMAIYFLFSKNNANI